MLEILEEVFRTVVEYCALGLEIVGVIIVVWTAIKCVYEMFKHDANVRLDLAARELYVGEARVPLTKTEFDVCEFLARHPGQVFSRDQIVEGVFGWDAESDAATISVHVSNARAKLKAAGAEPVQTVWGVGDRWTA